MNRYLFLYAVALTAAAVWGWQHLRTENRRLTQNQTALLSDLERYRTSAGDSAVSAQVLRLRCAEFEELRAADAAYIRTLGIRLRRVESASKSITATDLTLHTSLRDTVILHRRDTLLVRDTLRLFRWHDAWVTIEGRILRDSLACRIRSIDTLRQIVHRIPRRFLFFRWGTKALRQEITSTNPHTRIIHSEYIRIEK